MRKFLSVLGLTALMVTAMVAGKSGTRIHAAVAATCVQSGYVTTNGGSSQTTRYTCVSPAPTTQTCSQSGYTQIAGQVNYVYTCVSPYGNGVNPVYSSASTAAANTFHGSYFTCTFVAATSCALGASYWTGASVFATVPWGCDATNGTATDGDQFTVAHLASATATIYASASNSDTVTGVCWGP